MRLRYGMSTLLLLFGVPLAIMSSWYLIDRQSCLQHERMCGRLEKVVTFGAVPGNPATAS